MDLTFESFKEILLSQQGAWRPDMAAPRLWDERRLDASSALALKNLFFFLGLIFRYPTERIYSEVKSKLDVFSDFFKDYGGAVPALPPLDDLQPEYIRLFVTNKGFIPAVPYASNYQGDGLLMGDNYFRLREMMAATGFKMDASAKELEDHLAVLLEFCAAILGAIAEETPLPNSQAANCVFALMGTSYHFIKPMLGIFTDRINTHAHYDFYKIAGKSLNALFGEADKIYDQVFGFRNNSINDLQG